MPAGLEFEPRTILHGTLLDRATGQPIAGGAIVVDDMASTSSNAQGQFSLPTSPGRHFVMAWAPGYKVNQQWLDAAGGAITISLEPGGPQTMASGQSISGGVSFLAVLLGGAAAGVFLYLVWKGRIGGR